ncbi:hypothetical protein [Nocardia sp.]|uniref:hypothetical protein n=1 Tax=Nocardia sp. TaxID=1821 RepID=UPI002621DCAF|nr:hypothetical protein [Nocardia sp.]
MPDGRKKRYSPIRSVATLLAVGVYLAAATRLIVSRDSNDAIAGRLFDLALLASIVASFFALLWQDPAAPGSWRRGWTKRRVLFVFVTSGVLLTGATWSFFGGGTVTGQLMGQTTMVAAMLINAWSPNWVQQR